MTRILAQALISGIIVLSLSSTGSASWLIDTNRFHISVHGNLSCADCHSFDMEKGAHPDPDHVNQTLADFFQPEACIDCHGDIEKALSTGNHAGKKFHDIKDLKACLSCHEPHYDLTGITDNRQFDRSMPVLSQCGACHEKKDSLPEFSSEDMLCLQCHQSNHESEIVAAEYTKRFCMDCHGSSDAEQRHDGRKLSTIPLIDDSNYGLTPHANLACTVCHKDASQFRHTSQQMTACESCHSPHDEKTLHDAHSQMTCRSCHLIGGLPEKPQHIGNISVDRGKKTSIISRVHDMRISDKEAFCRQCHYKNNQNAIGAASMVLPPKSVMCMACHTATFSFCDWVTLPSLVFFFIGMGCILFLIAGGSFEKSHKGKETRLTSIGLIFTSVIKAVFSRHLFTIVKSICVDTLFQKRLFKQSKMKWILHGLIFYPFVFRFCYGMAALILSLYLPDEKVAKWMIDKNHPVTGFFFDITGLCIIAGVVMMVILKKMEQTDSGKEGLPQRDWIAFLLLFAIIIVGFILEGMRISMTGFPEGSGYAFAGYGLSLLFKGADHINTFYGYIWYVHAILTGAFLAYLPFSRMLHIIVAPVFLSAKAVCNSEHSTKRSIHEH